ncbi:MAG: hypothetical protein Q8L60_08890 [Gammaproteobacteria bacterium]|nr:hypothetical protein [Gammaproteobacteria bacterium]MDP2140632.1 hypothetical protein [Gammaproteobacteria bacterium]MDP2347404.1 hypothetical protein [Gammaproteobacteria bacterium]
MNTLMSVSKRMRSFAKVSVCCLPVLMVFPAQAQDALVNEQYDEMQRSIGIFSGALREALGLNNRAGIFNPLSGSVSGIYLAEQGIVLDVITPLAGGRSIFGPQTSTYFFQGLSSPFSATSSTRALRIQRPDIDAMRESMAMSLRAEAFGESYRDVMESIATIDFSAELESALRTATESAVTLRGLGQIDEAEFETMMREMNQMRQRLGEQMLGLQELRNRVTTEINAGEPVDDTMADQWRAALDTLRQNVEPLREQAVAKAAELREQSARSQLERQQQWQEELVAFEDNLFSTICDYGAALRALPDDEHLTIVLKGVGEDTGDRREDRIHVLQKSQMQRCLLGEITPGELQASAQSYSF